MSSELLNTLFLNEKQDIQSILSIKNLNQIPADKRDKFLGNMLDQMQKHVKEIKGLPRYYGNKSLYCTSTTVLISLLVFIILFSVAASRNKQKSQGANDGLATITLMSMGATGLMLFIFIATLLSRRGEKKSHHRPSIFAHKPNYSQWEAMYIEHLRKIVTLCDLMLGAQSSKKNNELCSAFGLTFDPENVQYIYDGKASYLHDEQKWTAALELLSKNITQLQTLLFPNLPPSEDKNVDETASLLSPKNIRRAGTKAVKNIQTQTQKAIAARDGNIQSPASSGGEPSSAVISSATTASVETSNRLSNALYQRVQTWVDNLPSILISRSGVESTQHTSLSN